MAKANAGAGRAAAAARAAEHQGKSGSVATVPHFVRLDFAYASQTVFYVMAGIMAAAAVVAWLGLRPGRQQEPPEYEGDEAGQTSGQEGEEAPARFVGASGAASRAAPLDVAGRECPLPK